MHSKAIIAVICFALFLIFAWMWVKDTRVEVAWEPDWPETLEVTAESLETVEAGADGEVGEGDLARAAERAHFKAYYFAQLRVAEQLGEMQVNAETKISDLSELDQELRASMATTIKAAREIDYSLEELDDAVRARVVVEVPGDRLQSFQETLLAALRSGRLKIERAPGTTGKAPGGGAEPSDPAGADSKDQPSDRSSEQPEEVAEVPEPTAPTATAPAESTPPVRVPRPAPQPVYSGAVIVLGSEGQALSAAPTIFDADGSELGNTFDLPPQRLAAGLRLVSSVEDVTVREHAGASPREFRATVSLGDLFLRDRLDREQARTFRTWLKEDRIVLVLDAGKK